MPWYIHCTLPRQHQKIKNTFTLWILGFSFDVLSPSGQVKSVDKGSIQKNLLMILIMIMPLISPALIANTDTSRATCTLAETEHTSVSAVIRLSSA